MSIITVTYNRRCIFPFVLNGIEHWGCVSLNGEHPWCSIENNEDNTVSKTDICPENWGKFLYDVLSRTVKKIMFISISRHFLEYISVC